MENELRPDVIVRVRLLTVAEGGRHKPIPAVAFGCPLFFEREGFDCRLLLNQLGSGLELGEERSDVPIKFLFPEHVKGRLRVGAHFKLWEGKDIATGEILEIVQ